MDMSDQPVLIWDEKYSGIAIQVIAEAKKEVLISSFKVETSHLPTGKELMKLLDQVILARMRSCEIKVLMNWNPQGQSTAKANKSAKTLFEGAGIPVRGLPDSRTVHSKLLIVDGKYLIIGSHNWTVRSLMSNFEASVLLKESKIVTDIREKFLALWERAPKK